MMINAIKRAITNRKLPRFLAEHPSNKQFHKNHALQDEVGEYKRAVMGVTAENFKPLSAALKSKRPRYPRFAFPKEKANKLIRRQLLQAVDKTGATSAAVKKFLDEPLMTDAAEMINEINVNEVRKFQRVNFVQKETKRLLGRERQIQGNFIGEKIDVQEPSLRKGLEQVREASLQPTAYLQYQANLNSLKNSKIHEFLYVFGSTDKELAKLYSQASEAEQLRQIASSLPDGEDGAPEAPGSFKQHVQVNDSVSQDYAAGIDITSEGLPIVRSGTAYAGGRNAVAKVTDSLLYPLRPEDQEYQSSKAELVSLTERQLNLARSIRDYENYLFLRNRESFATPMLFSKLEHETKLYYLKVKMTTPESVLDLFAFYDAKGQMCKEMNLPFYNRVTQIFHERNTLFDKGEYLDLFIISNWKYKKLLWRLLREMSSMAAVDTVHFLHSYATLHSREKGELLGGDYFDKVNSIVAKWIVSAVEHNAKYFQNDFETFSLLLEVLVKNHQLLAKALDAPSFLQQTLAISKSLSLEARPENSGNVARLFAFLCEVLMAERAGRLPSEALSALVEDAQRVLLLIQSNVQVLVNPVNFSDIVASALALATKGPAGLARAFVQGCRHHFTNFLLPKLEIEDIYNFTSLMVKDRHFDPAIFTSVRNNVIDRFHIVQTLDAGSFYGLMSHLAYLELRRKYAAELHKDELVDFPTLFLLKIIFSMYSH